MALALVCAGSLACGSAHRGFGAPSASLESTRRIEQRSLSDRPPLSVIERQGDSEAAIGFASLAHDSAALHAELGQLLRDRLSRAGFQAQVVLHGLGFELTLLADQPERARAAINALLRALRQPVSSEELAAAPPVPVAERAPQSAVSLCSAELVTRRRSSDPGPLDRERHASFARDRSALSVVGEAAIVSAVADALEAGPDWPELGPVRSSLPAQSGFEVLHGSRATLSVALTLADPNRALAAAARLGEPKAALPARLQALGDGLKLRSVSATAHPRGACLRIDSDVDASPLPDAKRLGFAIQLLEEEAALAVAESVPEHRIEDSALAESDPRSAARAAAYHALLEPEAEVTAAKLVALTTADEAPLVPSLERAVEQARREPVALESLVRVETGQPRLWALLAAPCAAMSESAANAGHAALSFAAASADPTRGVRLEPWVGASGMGLLAHTERAQQETEAQAAARLVDALGHALVSPPSARDVANARSQLIEAAGNEAHPLLDSLLEALAPGHVGALAPRGSVTSLQAASREAVLLRQRELLRSPQRLALLLPSRDLDVTRIRSRLARWLRSPDPVRPSPCAGDVSPPARGELSLKAGGAEPEGSYVAFRVAAKFGPETSLLADVLNLPGGALVRAMAEPELVGAARALVFGSSSAQALVIQVSAFPGREAEAISRVQKLFERLASGGVLTSGELEAAAAQQRAQQRLAALDPRYRIVQLLEPSPRATGDAGALRRLVSSLRPDAAIIARTTLEAAPASSGKPGSAR